VQAVHLAGRAPGRPCTWQAVHLAGRAQRGLPRGDGVGGLSGSSLSILSGSCLHFTL